jgi:ADP-ribosylglycohydrolase
MSDLKSRFIGCLVGLSVGDAIGLELEYDAGHGKSWLPGEVRAEHVRDFEFGRPFDLDSGQYTDDTQMAVVLAETITREGRVDGEAFGRELARLFTLDQVVGPSRACLLSVCALLDGRPWTESGSVHSEPGNCAAKRVAPVGLWHALDRADLAQDAEATAIVTHHDRRSIGGAVAMAAAVALAAADGPFDAPTLAQVVRESLESVPENGIADYVGEIEGWLALDEARAVATIAPAGREAWFRATYIAPHAIPSVLVSLYAALKADWDFCEALSIVYRAQGDVDSTGAMTGALVGAACGLEAIPERLHEAVKDAAKIKSVAANLHGKALSRQ